MEHKTLCFQIQARCITSSFPSFFPSPRLRRGICFYFFSAAPSARRFYLTFTHTWEFVFPDPRQENHRLIFGFKTRSSNPIEWVECIWMAKLSRGRVPSLTSISCCLVALHICNWEMQNVCLYRLLRFFLKTFGFLPNPEIWVKRFLYRLFPDFPAFFFGTSYCTSPRSRGGSYPPPPEIRGPP